MFSICDSEIPNGYSQILDVRYGLSEGEISWGIKSVTKYNKKSKLASGGGRNCYLCPSKTGNMYRTHTCGELRIQDINKEVTLAGWVQTVRKFGSITFIDLRDRYGITQLLFNEKLTDELDQSPLGREYVIRVKGTVNERSNKNLNIPTGEIEILVK